MSGNYKSLVLPFLDHEFQDISRVPPKHVYDFCRLALIAAPEVIVSPSFFVESDTSRASILTSQDFYGTNHVRFSMSELDLGTFFKKKQPSYEKWMKEVAYQGYYTLAESLIRTLRIPIRHRAFRIGESIAKLWAERAKTQTLFSFYHMTNCFHDSFLRKSVWQALSEVPADLNGSPFIWQNVCAILDRIEPRWRMPEFERSLRSFLLKSYFEALCSPEDAIVAFSDFQNVDVSDTSLSGRVLPLVPLQQFLRAAGVLQALRDFTVEELLAVINSGQCHDFRYRYYELIAATYEGEHFAMNMDSLENASYSSAVKWWRIFATWVASLCEEIGTDAKKRRGNWTIQALLDDAAARGFVAHLKNISNSSIEKLHNMQHVWLEGALQAHQCLVHIEKANINMRDQYNAQFAAVQGSNPSGNVVNQSITYGNKQIDPKSFLSELTKLGRAMKDAAVETEHIVSAGRVAEAELEAKAGNTDKAIGLLKSAGHWALEIATKIGAETITALLREALGLPKPNEE